MRSSLIFKINYIRKGANSYTGEKEVGFWAENTIGTYTGTYYIPNKLDKWCYWKRYYA